MFEGLGFARNPLLRHSAERNHGLLARHAGDPKARTVLIAGESPILRRNGAGVTALLPVDDAHRASSVCEQAFLGTLDDVPVVATLLEATAADLFRHDADFQVLDLRSIAVEGAVPPDELGILAEAKALLSWHARHRFCANCGAPTEASCAGFRRDCAACGAQHFPRTDPVAIMLVARGERCLLARQSRFAPGMYSCLAGFIEPGETIEDAVRRETLEESGVRVGAVRYVASQPWPFPANLMVGCFGEALTEEIILDRDELEDGRWFSRDEVALMLDGRHPEGLRGPVRMAIAHHLIRHWLSGNTALQET
jgi:NAD+ diphosphatase